MSDSIPFCRSDVTRNKAAKDLAKFVATQAREMKPEIFFTFMADLAKEYIYPLCYSSVPQENLGGVLAIGTATTCFFVCKILK